MATTLQESRYIVKNLYKQLLYLGRISFLGADYVRTRAKPQFMANAHLTDINEINKCIERTKYVIGEVEAMHKFHKYRTLKKAYSREFQLVNDQFDIVPFDGNTIINNNNNNSGASKN
ncbi:hypothetical protein SAMD00019534_037330 [Acytostelium subglobosum LB1]|uniref:hypothetical protein n=1 Tax=Acytostelium subglobosum LB1 TaxID=1410327 RepID=UPI0006450BAF|nr:hypothetical protein SAMD00019534_037330 [Acytostelium subglobosum LB1]GAM20558.1 hypothetical protein SAMD00019534_037330 [Acytostelium subglobosum LB1]|eukprot:XP_012760079.1 hypothetical protein SAMD00019534_037330 [Acytostelium subglobosum LB1]